jgi:DNA-binding CsgD family transcriptional regulator
MASAEGLVRCVEAIYAAGFGDDGWTGALAALTEFTGSVGATFEVFEKSPPRLTGFAVAGLPVGAETAYLDHYARHNPRAEYAFDHLSQVFVSDYQLIDEQGMDRNPYYAKYLTSIDLRYFLSGQVFNTERSQAIVSIQRSRRQGHVGRSEIDRMRRLLPHFRQAHDLVSRLGNARAATGAFERILDWLTDGVALVRSDGSVVYANVALDALATAGDGVALARSGIEFGTAEARAHLGAAIAAVCKLSANSANPPASTDFTVARPSGAPPYLVSVRPLIWRTDGPAITTGAIAAVFVRDPLQPNRTEARVLREAFGLTEAEADLAHGLQSGLSPNAYARARSLSRNTVYTHLRRIKEKTNATRMAELLARLNGASMPVRRA